jgi:hypothetical protein
MTVKKVNYIIAISSLFGLFIQTLAFVSCAERNAKKENEVVQKYDGVTIDIDISNINSLAILLAKDGTINRKGSGVIDTLDKDLFMGMTTDKIFDSLMNGISSDLLTYCNTSSPNCDTAKQTCKVEIAFGNNNSVCKIEHCVNGSLNDLPKPIKEFIEKAIIVTDSWYQGQKKQMLKKQPN